MITFRCQSESVNQLNNLASYDRHSILVDGPDGCGKTYLCRYYSNLVNADDFVVVDPSVNSIRDTLNECYNLDHNIVVCIENLDKGSVAASYTLLKFLEEPKTNVYTIVTCVNIRYVPDTIISRCSCISVSPPISYDIDEYSRLKDDRKYKQLSTRPIWKCVRTFKDVDLIYNMKPEHVDYYQSLEPERLFKDNVSNLTWNLGHYPDGSETPIDLVIRYILCNTSDKHLIQTCNECYRDMLSARVAKHAVLAKFVFEGKYGG